MFRIPEYLLALPVLLLFVPVNLAKKDLKCYQCAVEQNSLCTDEYLTPCPTNQAYDSCMTRISKTKADGFLIQKSCALAPCTLRDPKQSTGLGLDDCDRSKEEYDCTSCCKTDGCNSNKVSRLSQTKEPLLMIAVALVAFITQTLSF